MAKLGFQKYYCLNIFLNLEKNKKGYRTEFIKNTLKTPKSSKTY